MQEHRSACDSCRRRKVRCDSRQPCQRCVDGGVECTYGSAVRRVSATSYVRSLEQRVAELQQQLEAAAPAATGGLPLPLRQILRPPREQLIDLLVDVGDDLVVQQPTGTRIYRYSAAINILKTIVDMLNVGLATSPPSAPPGLAIVEAIDGPLRLPVQETLDWLDVVLPPMAELHRLITFATERALVCHQCLDSEAIHVRLDELYHAGKTHTVSKNKSFMSLVFAALALGERYSLESVESVQLQSQLSEHPPGFRYFRASRCIAHADLESCDLDHVLARMLQARYLQSVSHVSEAHSTLCKGIAVATHMGLHFDDSALHGRYTIHELDERRRVFSVLYMMDICLSFILGLPRTLERANARQTLGLPSDDLHDEGRDLLARDPFSSVAETVMAQKIFHTYAKILDQQSDGDADSWLSNEWVRDVQRDFEAWETMLPDLPNDPSRTRELLAQLTLREYYAGAQIILYAPCIHHLGRERSDPNFNIDGFTFGSNCVRAASEAVLLIEILETQNMLSAASWMHDFILTLAASVLTYFVIYSKNRVTIEESKSAITKAQRMLAALGQTNESSRRIHDSLSPYVDIVLG